jgi:hypothetical protein
MLLRKSERLVTTVEALYIPSHWMTISRQWATSAEGADIVMESIAQMTGTGQDDECNCLWVLKKSL